MQRDRTSNRIDRVEMGHDVDVYISINDTQ